MTARPEAGPTDGTSATETSSQTAPKPPVPGPPPRPTPGPTTGDARRWGRVADDGTVYVRTLDGERPVGQYPEGSPSEALAFYARRFDALAFEVELLEQRVRGAALTPEEARQSIGKVRTQVTDANAVGDLANLGARLDALGPVVAQQRDARREERARRTEEARQRKEEIVAEAERLGTGRDWRNGANRLRDLLEEWKVLPRLDRAADDALWHRFSSARTAYTRARKSHFAELDEKRGAAKQVKLRLIKEAEALADSTDWGPTAGRYRDLMKQWKDAGPAARNEDDQLWKRFRAAQDAFFGARDAATTAQDEEFAANAVVKDALLVEAEALVPVKDLDEAKRKFRDIADRWDAAGKVPRNRMKELEARIRKVEQAIRGVEDDKWRRTDPEKSARADDMIGKLEKTIASLTADLEKARAAGNTKRATEIEGSLASQRSFLEMAQRAAADFG